ncbi:MAG: hypothetical protein KAX64_02845 [Chromatiaceae bacterium]|jgi:hypothetical protein|nr:hypothetical protein [Chromatiaceae bacterium]
MNGEFNRAGEVAPCPRSAIGKGALVPDKTRYALFANPGEHIKPKMQQPIKYIAF